MKEKFLGIWRLVTCNQIDENGNVTYPWGEDAIGYIIYMPENIMAVQIMRAKREAFSTNDIMTATEQNCVAIPHDYNAYFGPYEIDEEKQEIIHHIAGHLFPNLVGKDNIRKYRFEGNKLFLTTTTTNPQRNLIWEKVN